MATAYTSLLGLALPVTGELQGTWGTTVNDSITSLLDTAVAGTTTLSTDTDVTLSTTTGAANQARQAIILWTANGTVTRNITAPAQSKIYTVINASAGTQSIVIRGVGPTAGVTIVKGESALVAWNGSDFIKISNTGGAASFTNVTVSGTTTLTGLTASQAVFTNASKELVSNAITGTGNVVMSASPTLTGTLAAAAATFSGNVTLGDATTDTVTVNGYMGVGGAANSAIAILASNTALGSTTQHGVYSLITGTSAATSLISGFTSLPATAAASFTVADVYGYRASNASKGAGSTITNQHGLYIADQTQGTNNYGITSLVSSGSNKWNIYASGTAANYFAGNVLVATTTAATGVTALISGTTRIASSSGGLLQLEDTDVADASAPFFVLQSESSAFKILSANRSGTGTTGSTERLRIDSSGNVGIGTSSPARLLHLANDGSADQLIIQDTDHNNTGEYWLLGSKSGVLDLSFTNNASGSLTSITKALSLTPTEAVFNDNALDIDFRVESDTNTHALFVDAGNSYVGINNSSPTVALDITGDLKASGNTTLGDATTDTVTVNGKLGFGAAGPSSNVGIYYRPTAAELTGSTTAIGLYMDVPFASDVTSTVSAAYFRVNTAAAAYTVSLAIGLRLLNAAKGAGSTITNQHGVYVDDQTQGTNNFGITSLVSSGANKWNIYASGTAANYFAGQLRLGTTTSTTSANIGAVIRSTSSGGGGLQLGYAAGSFGGAALFAINGGGLSAFTYTGDVGSETYTERLRIDSSGNLGLGVTPSAWSTAWTSLNIAGNLSLAGRSTNTEELYLSANAFNDGSWKYIASNFATQYYQDAGTHVWRTAPSGTAGNTISFTQAMTLDASGDWLLGRTSSSSYRAQITGATDLVDIVGTSVSAQFHNKTADVFMIGVASGDSIAFATNGNTTERLRITSDGYLRMASGTGGIQFNGDTAAANALDDYEEGTFTPAVTGSTSAGTGTYSTQVGKYTKIGNVVYYNIVLVWSAHTGTGKLYVTGLPFTASTGISAYVTPYVSSLTFTAGSLLQSFVEATQSRIRNYEVSAGGVSSELDIDTAAQIALTGFYYV